MEVLRNSSSEQQQKFNQISVELKYLTDTQWKAIYGLCPMTQELFNGIQLKRLKIGEELESAALEVFLKYPKFALPCSNCQSSRTSSILYTRKSNRNTSTDHWHFRKFK